MNKIINEGHLQYMVSDRYKSICPDQPVPQVSEADELLFQSLGELVHSMHDQIQKLKLNRRQLLSKYLPADYNLHIKW